MLWVFIIAVLHLTSLFQKSISSIAIVLSCGKQWLSLNLCYQTCWIHISTVNVHLHTVGLFYIQFIVQNYWNRFAFFFRNKSRPLGSRIQRYTCCCRRDINRISCFDNRGSDVIDTVMQISLIFKILTLSLSLSFTYSGVLIKNRTNIGLKSDNENLVRWYEKIHSWYQVKIKYMIDKS